ncbi:MAG: formate dehydrogenase accessory protein FdhE [Planctomycetota bacterium]
MKLQEVVDYYKKQSPQISELIDFFYRTYQLQDQYTGKISPVLSLTADTAIQKLQSGQYLLEGVHWTVNSDIFKNIIGDLLATLKSQGEKSEGLEKVISNISAPIPSTFPELLKNATKPGIKLTAPESETLIYLLWQTLKVFYRKEAEQFSAIDYLQYWLKPICPVCGGLPKISQLQKDSGKRFLFCHLCCTQWSVHRIGCPFCGNTSNDTLAYFYADGNRGYRVDVCNICRKYIKTIDENTLGRETIPELEDFITYNLDILAVSEGYQKSLNLL